MSVLPRALSRVPCLLCGQPRTWPWLDYDAADVAAAPLSKRWVGPCGRCVDEAYRCTPDGLALAAAWPGDTETGVLPAGMSAGVRRLPDAVYSVHPAPASRETEAVVSCPWCDERLWSHGSCVCEVWCGHADCRASADDDSWGAGPTDGEAAS